MLKDYKILIVDDHRMVKDLVSKSLSLLGYKNITFASDGVEALKFLENAHKEKYPFNIVLLDWMMPEMSGMELLEKCRSDNKYDTTAIIMLTEKGERDKILSAIKAGVTSYIRKPMSQYVLTTKMQEISTWFERDSK